MQEKIYIKPKAEHIAFYSDEEIAAELPIANYANGDGMEGGLGGMSGNLGTGDLEPGVKDE